MRQLLCLSAVAFSIALIGCIRTTIDPGEDPAIKPDVLYQGSACVSLSTKAGASWIGTRDAYESFFESIRAHVLGGVEQMPPEVDFDGSGVLLVKMGSQPTGGYRLDVKKQSLEIQGNVARIALEWVVPPADAVLPQVVTCPCILIRLPKSGFTLIEVLDQNGEVRAMVDVN